MDAMPKMVAIIRWNVSLWSAGVVGGRVVREGGKIKQTIGGEQLGNWESNKNNFATYPATPRPGNATPVFNCITSNGWKDGLQAAKPENTSSSKRGCAVRFH